MNVSMKCLLRLRGAPVYMMENVLIPMVVA